MLPYLLQGLALGLTAAIQPGPFQAYLMSLVARVGGRRALPAGFAPLFSDGPILMLVLFLLTTLPAGALTGLRIVGGVFLLYLAWNAFRAARRSTTDESPTVAAPSGEWGGVLKASLMNMLNPNPYIFWATVAGPILLAAWRQALGLGLAFLAGFYAAIIGGNMLLILALAGAGRIDPRVNRAMGLLSAVILFAFGLYQLAAGIRGLGMAYA
jgi:threonine/homoserine/homoserine lactone efflux protein